MSQNLTRTLAFALLCVTLAVAPATAQMTGRIVGTVVNDSDQSISEMNVRATDLIDGKVFFAKSDSDGAFVLSDLPGGTYAVSADTANTQWVQKHDSPIVKVSANPATVTLTLVSLAQLQGDGGGGGGFSPITGVTLGAAVAGAVTGTYAAINSNDAKDEAALATDAANAARLAADRASDAAEKNRLDLLAELDRLSKKVDGNTKQLDLINQRLIDINGDLIGLNGRLDFIEDVLQDLWDTLN